MEVTIADKNTNSPAWQRYKAGDPRYIFKGESISENKYVPFGNTKRKSTSHKQSKISSTEYQKVKKRKDFNASDWKWDGDQDLYVREEITEGMAFDEKRTDELQVVAKDMFKHALANAKKKAGK